MMGLLKKISSKIFRLIIVLFMIILLPVSCSKENRESESFKDSYIIELDNSNKILSVLHTDDHNITYKFSYEYQGNTVKKYSDTGTLLITYFLDESGLADSASNGVKFKYDADGFFISDDSNNAMKEVNTYSNGNRTMTKLGSNFIYYEYDSMINIIDILNFRGPFLGRLNKNLILKETMQFQIASSRVETHFQYVINEAGLVTQRTANSRYFNGTPERKLVTTFVYKYSI
jgi:hypothetical protein